MAPGVWSDMNVPRPPLITFAIPTYNFGRFIEWTVLSIVEGASLLDPSEFEIIVLDGGSADSTDSVMEELTRRFANVHYQKNSVRGGIDKDMAEVAALARGDFIWLFSADDLLVRDWDSHLLPLLDQRSDVYLVNAEICDLEMRSLRPNPIFDHAENEGPVTFHLPRDYSEYVRRAKTLEAFFSFMSSIIIERETWSRLDTRTDYFGTCWAHCAKLAPLFGAESKITYVNAFLIKKRGGNDSFMEHGLARRIGIAVDGWGRLISEFYGGSERERLFELLRRDIPLVIFIYAKLSAAKPDDLRELERMGRFLFVETLPSKQKPDRMYLLFRSLPNSVLFTRLSKPMLPFLSRIRHWWRKISSR